MFNHGSSTLFVSALLFLSTGCASLQSDAPLQVELNPIQEAVDDSTLRIDYIDDRTEDATDEVYIDGRMDQAFDEDLDDEFDQEFDQEFHERSAHPINRSDELIKQITLLAAYRNFTDNDTFDGVDDQTALGFEYAQEIDNGFGFEIGAMGSLRTDGGLSGDVDVTGAAGELYGGGRYFLRTDSRWLPYAGVGLSAVLSGVDNDNGGNVTDDQDFTFGVYLHTGVQYHFTDGLYVGADFRTLLGTDLNLETISGDADYVQIGLILGFRL